MKFIYWVKIDIFSSEKALEPNIYIIHNQKTQIY